MIGYTLQEVLTPGSLISTDNEQAALRIDVSLHYHPGLLRSKDVKIYSGI